MSTQDLEARIRRAVSTQNPDRLRELLRSRAEIKAIKEKLGPQNKDDLWQWFKDRLGVELSRVAVCPGHVSQLDLVWEVYNFEVLRVLWVMNRGGGKTSLAAWLDDCQAEHWPGWASFCVPMDAEILTRRGWMGYDDLRAGEDETIGFNPETMQSEWTLVECKSAFSQQPTHRVGNKLWGIRVTEGHTWSVTDRGYRTGANGPGTEEVLRSFEDMRLNDRVRLSARAEGGELDIIPREAALIAWLWGDGHCVTRMSDGERGTYVWGKHDDDDLGKASILQAKPEGVAAVRILLEDVPHTVTVSKPALDHHHPRYEFRIDPAHVRAVLQRARISELGLWGFVQNLTPEAREGLLAGFMGAEGWVMEDKRYGGPGTACFAQNEGPVLDAMVFCSYLCGYRPTLNSNDRSSFKANAKNWQVMLCKPHSYAGKLQSSLGAVEDVWCPTTGLGTWTVRWQNQILLTGNTIGANRTQGDRKYEYLLPLVVEGGVIGGKELDHVERSIATKTQYKNGSSIEIALGSSPENANGPRTPRLHRDEVELMQDDTYKQAGNIPAGRKMRDGRYAPAQILDTSTMKVAGGRVDTLMKEYEEAKQKGQRPRMEVRICCLYEVAAENPACRSVPEEQRRARLIELKRDPNEICDCDTYVSDTWPSEEDIDGTDEGEGLEDEPRTLESVCQGRFFRSRGHKAFDDVQTLFLENDRETWNAEQECSEPSREGTYLKSYSQVRHGISGYRPDPENGLIYQAVDWGADDEHAVLWFQILDRPVQVKAHVGDNIKIMPVGAVVAFSELFEAQIGNVALGQKVVDQEAGWIMAFPGWRMHERYPDSANLGARLDWRDHLGLVTTSRIKKDFAEEVKYVRSRIGNRGRFYIDINACPWFDKAIRAWRQKNGHEVHDWASHPMAAFRYFEHNIQVTERKNAKQNNPGTAPAAANDGHGRVREREAELVSHRKKNPLRAGGGSVAMIGAKPKEEVEEFSVGGAGDSPLRDEGLRMGGEGDYLASFGGHER